MRRHSTAPAVPSEPAEPERAAHGQVYVVFSGKGGSGKSVLSTNLAAAVNSDGRCRVCLVDLDLEFGDVAILLGLTPRVGLLDLADSGQVTSELVQAVLTQYRPGLDCLLAPAQPADAERVSPGLVAASLRVLRELYDVIIVDTASQFSEITLEACDAADAFVLVTTPEIPALKNLRLSLDVLDLLGTDPSARAVVLNRSDPRVGLRTADVRKVLGVPIMAEVPAHRAVVTAINRGMPIVEAEPGHAVSTAVAGLAATLTGAGTGTPPPRRRGLRPSKTLTSTGGAS